MYYCTLSNEPRRPVCRCDEYLTILCEVNAYDTLIDKDILFAENELVLVDIGRPEHANTLPIGSNIGGRIRQSASQRGKLRELTLFPRKS